MIIKAGALSVAFGLLGALASPLAAQPFPSNGLPPHEVVTMLRSTRLVPLGQPARRGDIYVVRALDPYGQPVNVMVDAHFGDILSVTPTGPRRFVGPGPAYPRVERYPGDIDAPYEADPDDLDLAPPGLVRPPRRIPQPPPGVAVLPPDDDQLPPPPVRTNPAVKPPAAVAPAKKPPAAATPAKPAVPVPRPTASAQPSAPAEKPPVGPGAGTLAPSEPGKEATRVIEFTKKPAPETPAVKGADMPPPATLD